MAETSSATSSIYPPPAIAMLPPPLTTRSPAQSSSSHSSRKRKRSSEAEVDAASSVASSASSQTNFTRRTRQRIAETTGGKCWHCGATPVDVCHVIGQRDTSFASTVDRGLISFTSVDDKSNALPLCPNCHRNFDNIEDPGLLFIPTDLQYFIDYEQRDFETRTRSATINGPHILPRTTPKPDEYRDHLIRTGAIPPDAQGGLYWRYTLKDYFPTRMDKSFIPGVGPYQEPGVWAGAPMAALKRAFQCVFNPSVAGVPEEMTDKLYELSKLYKRRLEVGQSSAAGSDTGSGGAAGNEGPTQPPGAPSSSAAGSGNAGGVGPSVPSAADTAGTQTPPGTSARAAQPVVQRSFTGSWNPQPQPQRISDRPRLFRWGPGSTAESNVARYLAMLR